MTIIENIYDIQALLNHKANHYFCIRRFDRTPDYFFIIDSLNHIIHRTVPRSRIKEYINNLQIHNSSIYVLVKSNSLQIEPLSIDSIRLFLHPLPICEADGFVFNVQSTRHFDFH